MHSNITLEISPTQVRNLIEKLPLEDKIRLVRELEKETWARRLNSVVQRMRSHIKKARIPVKDIDQICEEVKREYDEKYRRH